MQAAPSVRVRRLAAAASLVAVLGASAGCDIAVSGFREEAQDQWAKTYTLRAGGVLEIDNTNGFIDVTVASGDTVSVKVQRVARAATSEGAKELLAKARIKEEATPDRVHLSMERVSSGISFGGGVEMRYTVTVPAATTVTLSNTNGRISVADVTGATRLETTNGEITTRNLGGTLRATTTNGSIDVDMRALAADVRLETTNGGVTVKLPADAKASLSARCTNGGIDVEGLEVEEVEKTRRRLDARLNGGGPRVEVETTNGGITFARR